MKKTNVPKLKLTRTTLRELTITQLNTVAAAGPTSTAGVRPTTSTVVSAKVADTCG